MQFTETDNTRAALSLLEKYSAKPVQVRHISDLRVPGRTGSVTYLGATEETADSFVVWLSDTTPEASFVHEILHQVLKLEGFPAMVIDETFARRFVPDHLFPLVARLRNNFSSTLEHFDLFHRLQRDFALDLSLYYAVQVEQKLNRLRGYKKNNSDPSFHFDRLEDILLGLDYFHWGDAASPLVRHFHKRFPEAAKVSAALFEAIDPMRPLITGGAHTAADLIKTSVLEYGESRGLYPEYINVWRSVNVARTSLGANGMSPNSSSVGVMVSRKQNVSMNTD